MNQSPNIVNKLLAHYQRQYSLAILYDHLASIVNDAGYIFFAKYIKELANDKIHTHREIFLDYFDKAGIIVSGAPKLIAITEDDTKTVLNISKLIYNIESNVRDEINNIAAACIIESDFEDFNFLQWYIADGLKDFGEIEQIVKILELGNNSINEDLAISKYLSIKNDN